jgi:hypothetical protein
VSVGSKDVLHCGYRDGEDDEDEVKNNYHVGHKKEA